MAPRVVVRRSVSVDLGDERCCNRCGAPIVYGGTNPAGNEERQ